MSEQTTMAPERITGEHIYDFRIISKDDLSNYPNSLEKIFHRQITGFLIKNVLSKEKVEQLVDKLPLIDSRNKIVRPEVEIYPKGFAAYLDNPESNDMSDLGSYFEDGAKYKKDFSSNFGFDVHDDLKDVFESISGGREFDVAPGFEGKGHFTPSQFRSFYPKGGALPVHCGNVFQRMYHNFYEQLSKYARIKNQMSYFIMLQKPEQGGRLALFDILWEEGQKMRPFEELELSDGTVVNALADPKVRKMYINPEPGDMIIFAGGEIWHKVEDIIGSKNRISIGGFFTFSNDDKKILFWA